jgi:translocation protein SEC63
LSVGDEFQTVLQGEKAESGLATIEKRVLAEGDSSPFASGLSATDKQRLLSMDEGRRRKVLALLWAYLGRIDLGDSTLNDEKFEVAPTAQLLNDCFTVVCLAYGNLRPLLASYQVSQCLIQAVAPGESALRQLPYFSPGVVRAVEGEWSRTHMSVQQFMALPAEVRRKRACGTGLLSTAELRSAETIASQLPYLVVEKTMFKVHGEKYITPGSLIQFIVKARFIPPGMAKVPPISEKDLEEVDKSPKQTSDEEAKQKRIAPPVAYAPFFARDHNPRWHIFLADTKQAKIAVPPFTFSTFDKPIFTDDGKPTFNIQTLSMTFGAPPQPGTYIFTMHMICDSYMGLDTKQQVTMVVEDASKAETIPDDGEISEPDEGEPTAYVNDAVNLLTLVAQIPLPAR